MGAPQLDHDEIGKHIDSLSRAPFRAVLTDILAAAPSETALKRQAEANPDRWAQTLAIVAKLGGFNDKLEAEVTLSGKVEGMSDAAIEARIKELERQINQAEE